MMNPGPKGISTRAYNWLAVVETMADEGEVFRIRDVREASQIQAVQMIAAERGAEFALKGSTILFFPPNCVMEEQPPVERQSPGPI